MLTSMVIAITTGAVAIIAARRTTTIQFSYACSFRPIVVVEVVNTGMTIKMLNKCKST